MNLRWDSNPDATPAGAGKGAKSRRVKKLAFLAFLASLLWQPLPPSAPPCQALAPPNIPVNPWALP